MKYIMATILCTIGCYLVFGIHGSLLRGIGVLFVTGGGLALMGKRELTKPIPAEDFIPKASTVVKTLPVVFGMILFLTIITVLGENALETLFESRAVGVAFWLFLLSLVVHRYLAERTSIQQTADGNGEYPGREEGTS